MALPFGPPLFPKAEAACPQWQDIQEVIKVQAPQVRWLSIWRYDQATLAQKRVGIFSQNLCCRQARGNSLSWPNRIDRGGLFQPVEGVSHQKEVQILHCFCGPLILIAFCAPPNRQFCCRDHACQATIWKVCSQARCPHLHPMLSLW